MYILAIQTLARDFVTQHSYHVNMEDNYIPERNKIWPIVTRCFFLFSTTSKCTCEEYGWVARLANVGYEHVVTASVVNNVS